MTDDNIAAPAAGKSPLLAVYRHAVHKLQRRSHTAAQDSLAGVRINEPVPLGADTDAGRLSRPPGSPEQALTDDEVPFRVSLLTGRAVADEDQVSDNLERAIRGLVQIDDPAAMHTAWMQAEVPSWFPESAYYPYTSVKYHTLLTAALLRAYQDGADFEDLYMAVADPDAASCPHETICRTRTVHLQLTTTPGDKPAAPLGDAPTRSWADVWSRLPEHPLSTDTSRQARILDAQLRRIQAWSTALQYLEEHERIAQQIGGDR